jgi:hypothetical protein
LENPLYKPEYSSSRALIVGINDYKIAPPLGYARQDAEAFAAILQSVFAFPAENIQKLFDCEASRSAIHSAFLNYAGAPVEPDDRLVVFFAGHGHTRTGNRGEVGYLVPADGDPSDLSSLLRWDDLTRNAELIPAKHILFVMDACYGGLMFTRGMPPGSSRFLRSMLQRYTRQAIAAGKADETVADSGGPRPGHSIFTGHLLDALEGGVSSPDGIVTASAVMAYVYDRVGKDQHSNQTPDYGFIEGDGDFVFAYPETPSTKDDREGSDLLVELVAETAPNHPTEDMSQAELVKEYLSDDRFRIRLDDTVSAQIRSVSYTIRDELFPLDSDVSAVEFARRLSAYEDALRPLRDTTILLSRWGGEQHLSMVSRVISRLADGATERSGMVAWIGMHWYPLMYLMYAGGIAALYAGNYAALTSLLTAPVADRHTGEGVVPAVVRTVREIREVELSDLFKTLPGHERHYVPRSEYLLGSIQPAVEDLLFLGNSYEALFDRFEILYALTFADLEHEELRHTRGPVGRFGWKHHRRNGPFDRLLEEARRAGAEWGPIRAGLFHRSSDRFEEVASKYREGVLEHLTWF